MRKKIEKKRKRVKDMLNVKAESYVPYVESVRRKELRCEALSYEPSEGLKKEIKDEKRKKRIKEKVEKMEYEYMERLVFCRYLC